MPKFFKFNLKKWLKAYPSNNSKGTFIIRQIPRPSGSGVNGEVVALNKSSTSYRIGEKECFAMEFFDEIENPEILQKLNNSSGQQLMLTPQNRKPKTMKRDNKGKFIPNNLIGRKVFFSRNDGGESNELVILNASNDGKVVSAAEVFSSCTFEQGHNKTFKIGSGHKDFSINNARYDKAKLLEWAANIAATSLSKQGRWNPSTYSKANRNAERLKEINATSSCNSKKHG
jgi:hypothetical protein